MCLIDIVNQLIDENVTPNRVTKYVNATNSIVSSISLLYANNIVITVGPFLQMLHNKQNNRLGLES